METVYSPKIDEKHIPILYRLGRQIRKPMTYIVNEAIAEYLTKVVDSVALKVKG